MTKKDVLLDIKNLDVHFATRRRVVKAVDGVSLKIYKGERFGLAGESGSGKTTMLLALLRMIKTPGYIAGGSAVFDDGTDLFATSLDDFRKMRMERLTMVPQGAMNSLNPVMRIADQMMLTMREHGDNSEKKTSFPLIKNSTPNNPTPPSSLVITSAISCISWVGVV